MQTEPAGLALSHIQDVFKEPDFIDLNTICRSFHKFTSTNKSAIFLSFASHFSTFTTLLSLALSECSNRTTT